MRPVASRHRGQASTHRHLRVVCQAKDADSGHRGEGGHQQAAGEQGSARRAASPPAPPAPTASPPAAVVGAAQQSGAAQQPSYEKLCALMEQLITKVDATRTDLGCVFEVSAATALAGGRRAAVVRDVPALLEAAGLPHDAAAKRCIIAALIKVGSSRLRAGWPAAAIASSSPTPPHPTLPSPATSISPCPTLQEGALPEFRRLVMKSAGEVSGKPKMPRLPSLPSRPALPSCSPCPPALPALPPTPLSPVPCLRLLACLPGWLACRTGQILWLQRCWRGKRFRTSQALRQNGGRKRGSWGR